MDQSTLTAIWQQAAKTDYFRDMVRREGQSLPAHKFHAQIISLKEAA